MRSHSISATILVFFMTGAIALMLAGCGSVSLGDYKAEVSEINGTVAAELNEVFEGLSEHEFESEEEKTEAMVQALEEAVEISQQAVSELESVKVPAGMEDFHKELVDILQSNLSAYEELVSTLVPAQEHGEEGSETPEEQPAESSEGAGH